VNTDCSLLTIICGAKIICGEMGSSAAAGSPRWILLGDDHLIRLLRAFPGRRRFNFAALSSNATARGRFDLIA
jgi:hypothetical protein